MASASMIDARDNRQSVRTFDVDLFRNKLENFMRKQAEEMCEVVNNKKRKFGDRWSETEKEDLELSEGYRDDTVFQFGKRQRGSSYYPIDDDELDMEEVSPLALPSPVTVYEGEASYFEVQQPSTAVDEEADDSLSMAMRRHLTGYSEASTAAYMSDDGGDDNVHHSWMPSPSLCPPLSRASISSSTYSPSMPNTPNNGSSEFDGAYDNNNNNDDDETLMDLSVMEPHERALLAALAPERFEKAALIKKAFRQSDQILNHLVREEQHQQKQQRQEDDTMMMMEDGEYDQVFDELMHI